MVTLHMSTAELDELVKRGKLPAKASAKKPTKATKAKATTKAKAAAKKPVRGTLDAFRGRGQRELVDQLAAPKAKAAKAKATRRTAKNAGGSVARATAPKKVQKKQAVAKVKRAPAKATRPLTPAERKLTAALARAVGRLRELERTVKAQTRALPKLAAAATKAERARHKRELKQRADAEKAKQRAERAARAAADKLARQHARNDAAAARREAKKRRGHPVQGCGLSYQQFKPFDQELYGEIATALNVQREREGRFGKATRAQVLKRLGEMKREKFAEYEQGCARLLQEAVDGKRELPREIDPRDFTDEVPF